jgi:hypothetical protein
VPYDPSQLSYDEPPALFNGMTFSTGLRRIESGYNSEAALVIPFGVVVAHNTAVGPRAMRLPSGATAKLVGVVLNRTHYAEVSRGVVAAPYLSGLVPTTDLSVMAEGEVVMYSETAFTVGDPVFVRISGAGQLGAIRNVADGANTIDCTLTMRFKSTGVIGGLARVRVNFL